MMIKAETKIKLNRFIPRDYQLNLCRKFESGDLKKFLVIWPRRCLSGMTHITMGDGSWKYLKDIIPGDEILSWDGTSFVKDTVKYHWKTEIKPTKIIKSFGSLPLVSSNDHVFAHTSSSKDIVKWTALKDLKSKSNLLQYDGLLDSNLNIDIASDILNNRNSLKRLPKFIWNLNRDSILRFFSDLISSHGNILIHKQRFISKDRNRIIPPVIEVTLSCAGSDLYAWDIYWLLRKIGIFPQVPYKEKNSNWKIKIAKSRDIKVILSNKIYGKEEARIKALHEVSLRNYKPIKKYGCIFTSFKIKDGIDEELYDIETTLHHNFIANGYLVHNSGKDICALNLLLRCALRKIGTYFYIFPTFSMGRRIMWDAIDIQGRRILNYYIPDEIVESRHEQQMRIRLINGSQIQIIGSDNFDNTLIGTNAVGMIFSEFALQDPRAWSYSIPILKASNGWALFVSTPRGKNALWELYNVARLSPDWFCEKLSIDDTKHVDIDEIEKEISDGQMSRDLAMQEWWTSFDLGVEGSFYAKYIDDLRRKGQITHVPWEPYFPVHTAWDLGYNDPTTIIFFQIVGPVIRVIDYYENNKKGLEHYVKILKEKEYSYGKHIAPFDIAVHDLSTGISRWKMMHDLGVTFVKYHEKQPSIEDGIEAVRRNLPKMWFDEKNCALLLKYLENYRQEYDAKRKVYKSNPLHDFSSHASDSMRYLCVALPKVQGGSSSAEAIDKRYREAVYGEASNMPSVFRNDNVNDYY